MLWCRSKGAKRLAKYTLEDGLILIDTNSGYVIKVMRFEDMDKHLHFQFIISGTKENEGMALGYLSSLTLMTIPVVLDYYSDMSVFVIENNQETFSASATEKINKTLWLPII